MSFRLVRLPKSRHANGLGTCIPRYLDYVLTGGEDGTARLWLFDDGGSVVGAKMVASADAALRADPSRAGALAAGEGSSSGGAKMVAPPGAALAASPRLGGYQGFGRRARTGTATAGS